MFKKFFQAIGSLFSSLFGGSGKKDKTPARPKPVEQDPQDGSEVPGDTSIVKANELDVVVIDPNEPDVEFDEDIFDDASEPETDPAPITEEEDASGETPAAEPPKSRFLWCLDNGHGKLTRGKRSPLFDDGQTRFFEYEFNRDIVKRIIKGLEEKGIAFFNVVPEVDIDNFLEGRVNRANGKQSDIPKLFLSVHSNASPARSSEEWAPDSVSGTEPWFYHGSKKGQKVAAVFQKHLIEKTGWKNRHLKSRPERQFYVLRKTKMTAILTENGFYNNKVQSAELMKDEIRQKIADAHLAAIFEIEENGI